MTIFLILNGVAVVFLLYVLANFWKDGHRPKNRIQESTIEPLRQNKADVIVMRPPVSHSAKRVRFVIPQQAIAHGLGGGSVLKPVGHGATGTPVRRISTK